MAHALRIDTLAFARRLKEAGADERLAEAIVEGITTADASDLATKTDIAEVRGEIAEVRSEIAEVRSEVASSESRVTAEIAEESSEVAELRADVHSEIAALKSDLRTYRAETRADINGAIAKIGALMFLLMTLAAAVLKYIGS